MKCAEIRDHFQAAGDWVNWNRTTDTFKAGDPDRVVQTVAVVWKPTLTALKTARDRGTDLVVAHESLAVKAVNGDPEPEIKFALPSEKSLFDWLAETGLVVFRCHDFWDGFPEEGIRWAWQRGLGLGGQIVADAYPLLVTEIEPRPLRALADHVLDRIRPLGQNGVLMIGDSDRVVHRVATGTGVTTDPIRMQELGADVGILTDDYYLHVRMGAHAIECGMAGIVVNHGVSEEWGIQSLAEYLTRTFPQLDVFHIPQRCPYRVVT